MTIKSPAYIFTSLILLSLFITGCETEVDLLAPYKSTPVIVGVLDYGVDTQFVRINRTFLGEGDPNVFAGIKDSVEYDPSEVSAKLIKKADGEPVDSIDLNFIELPSRDPGVFYDENVGFYFTDEELFTAEEINNIVLETSGSNVDKMTYEISATLRGVNYRGETGFPSLSGSTIIFPQNTGQGIPPKIEFYRLFGGQGTFRPISFRFAVRSNVKQYEGVIRTYYDYSDANGNTVTGAFTDFNLGSQGNVANQGDDSFDFNSESWYISFENQIKEIPGVEKVRIAFLEFRLTGINVELDNYISIVQPVSDFTPVLSTYTNLSGGAIGIFGTRHTVTRPFWLTEPSLAILNQRSVLAEGPCFCVQDWAGSAWVCTDAPLACP